MMEIDQPIPRRIAAVKDELDNAATEYTWAKDEFEGARVKFESARERLASIRRLASSILTGVDFYTWQREHPDVRYAAIPIADGILTVLRDHAYLKAWEVAQAKEEGRQIRYVPTLTLVQIVETLENGGFEFRTTSASREVNATLLNLAGVVKPNPEQPLYQIEQAQDILSLYIPAVDKEGK